MQHDTRTGLGFLAALTALTALHCGDAPKPKAASPTPAAPLASATAATPASVTASTPDGRLPTTVSPTRYRLALDVDPDKPRFSGLVAIDLTLSVATRAITLHGIDIHVTRAALTSGGTSTTPHVTARRAGGDEPEELVLSFDHELPAGHATLEIAYDAPFSETLGGLYRVKDGGRYYAFTQLEATDARRAFPCFDEPGFKVPFDVTLTVPKGALAVANTVETARKDAGAKTVFTFAPTPPLPTYLVAFAVGDFDVKQGPTSPVPIRIIATKGKAHLGDLAIAEAAKMTAGLASYFDIAYPYGKLDLVGVPNFRAGAMENPGLITFREEALLFDPAKVSQRSQHALAIIVGHELAHQWFGDLVTMTWWNDAWLNEGFATWMETRIVDQSHPSWNELTVAVSEGYDVMDTDALSSARAVRQPVRSSAEAEEAFDGITYQKGGAVLAMIEAWLTPAVFQKGVRAYLKAHANGSATADDLFAALSAASGRDVAPFAATFLDRTGVPAVSSKAVCANGRLTAVDLAQSAWKPAGAVSMQTARALEAPWSIPVCLKIAGRREPLCAELTAPETRVDVAAEKLACPAWIYPNANDAGYYRSALTEEAFAALAKHLASLGSGNKVGLLSNAWAQVRAGKISSAMLLRTLPAFDAETDRPTVHALIETLREVLEAFVDDGSAQAFRAYASARLAPHKKRLFNDDMTPRAMPSATPQARADAAASRADVFAALGQLAGDAPTLTRAETMTRAWLVDPSSVDSDLAATAVSLASKLAGAGRFDELRAAAKNAKAPTDRTTALMALYSFENPGTLDRSLGLTLTDEVRSQDFIYMLRGTANDPHTQAMAFDWTKAHWQELRAKLKGFLATELVYTAGGRCTDALRNDVETFLKANASDIDGAARPIAERLETLALCASLRNREGANATRALAEVAHGPGATAASAGSVPAHGRAMP